MSHIPGFNLRTQTDDERLNVDAVCHHLALVAIFAATDEVALTLDPGFRLDIDGIETDRWGYLALIEANHASYGTYPPLDVAEAYGTGDYVIARLEPRCIAHFRLSARVITRMWMSTNLHAWFDWLTWRAQIWPGEG